MLPCRFGSKPFEADQRGWEFPAWVALCHTFHVETYVELGRGRGHSSAYVRKYLPHACIVTVDIREDAPELSGSGIVHLKGTSADPAIQQRVLSILGGWPDAVFIDADHTGENPQRDFETWWPYTQKIMGMHDVEGELFDSARFWRAISLRYPSLLLSTQDNQGRLSWPGGDSAGIGVLFQEDLFGPRQTVSADLRP